MKKKFLIFLLMVFALLSGKTSYAAVYDIETLSRLYPVYLNNLSINSYGDVGLTLSSLGDGDTVSYVWSRDRGYQQVGFGEYDDLYTPPLSISTAVDINDQRMVLGYYQDETLEEPGAFFANKKGTYANWYNSEPVAMSRNGNSVIKFDDLETFNINTYPGVSRNVDIDTAVDINNQGVILGTKDDHSVFWQSAGENDYSLRFISQLDSFDRLIQMNDRNAVLGIRNGQAVIWREGLGVTELGAFTPYNINNSNAVVGALNGEAVIWDESNGLRKISSLLSEEQKSIFDIASAVDINDSGQIVAWGLNKEIGPGYPGANHIFVLTTPEPLSMILYGLGGVAMLILKRRKRVIIN